MADEKKTVEAEVAVASTEVKPDAASASPFSPEELEQQLDAERAARLKAERDRDNYRSGLLKAKGKKAKLDLTDPDKAEEFIEETAQQKILEDKAKKEDEERSAELETLKKQNAELARALKAKQASTAISGGASAGSAPQASSEVKDPNAYWTQEQKDWLKKNKGFTDEQIARAEKLAREHTATGEQTSPFPKRTY
jgi:hypothetical protein